jgi:hypothetical protein
MMKAVKLTRTNVRLFGLSSNLGLADFRPTRSSLDANEESLEEESSSVKARRKSQEELIKVTQFARPPSAHGDPTVGFAFMKAKPPQMDFTRKLVQKNSLAKVKDNNIEKTPVKTPRNTPPLPEISEIKLTSLHSSPSIEIGSSTSVQCPPPPNTSQINISSREDLGINLKLPMV